jgi:hypothetical protein
MFEDEEDDDYTLSEFENWYDENFMYFQRESGNLTGPTLETSLFYTGVYSPVMKELSPGIRKLMLKQYPSIDREFRPLVLEYIDWVVASAGHRLLLNLYVLLQDEKEGIDLREKYPDFENWINLYARPQEADLITEADLAKFTTFTSEEKKELIEEENKDIIRFFNRQQFLKKEYYDIVQPIVFRYYLALQDLDYDGWIIYSVHIREDYEDFKYRCEHIETFIEYEFQEEDINLKYDEFQAKFRMKYNEKWEKEHPFPENGMKENNSTTQNDS